MQKQFFDASQLYGFLPTEIKGVKTLAELALDMQWSWNHAADQLWQQLDPALWELTHNPWVVLQTISRDQLERQLADPGFRKMVDELVETKEQKLNSPAWFQQHHSNSSLTCVAYFSMEYMLSEALPIYVGGLGNVAGDQLKAASDLGVPVVAVGLLYQQGYFRQQIDKSGLQQALFPYNDPGQLPVTPVRLPNGEWLRLKISLPGYPVWLRTWQVQAGRTKLYLLDSNDPANLPVHRGITSELYGGGAELRMQQEIVLGIGGWRILAALNIKPEVCHLNEGHAAFLVLERANQFMKETGLSFEVALSATRAGNIFTTHTAVAAGFDHFSPSLVERYFSEYAANELHIDFNSFMSLGRENENNFSEYFNMAYLAMHGCGAVNAVSNLHEKVSRQLFATLYPRWPIHEIPIGHITNGVHMPTWDSEFADELWTQACGKERWKGELETLETDMYKIPDEDLWEFRNKSRRHLIDYVRQRFERQVMVSGLSSEVIQRVRYLFDSNILTLGFARRFVAYKRPNLLLHDPERLIRILTSPQYPVQLLIAGKAPPYDDGARSLIQQWIQFIRQHNLFNHVMFLADYDVLLTEHLVQGVDVWLNTPRRPWEACGTSGMKVLVNGGMNLSELDGWWAEAYTSDVGWALGDGREHGDDPGWDALEANALYDLLEQEIVPAFYTRNERNVPEKWVARIRNSMATLTPKFSANRTVREYTEKYYLPAAEHYVQRAANKGAAASDMIKRQHTIKNKWNGIRMQNVNMESTGEGYVFNATMNLNGIGDNNILVEVYANGKDGMEPERIKMHATGQAPGEYKARVITTRPAGDYTIRCIPNDENMSFPLENNCILWQH